MGRKKHWRRRRTKPFFCLRSKGFPFRIIVLHARKANFVFSLWTQLHSVVQIQICILMMPPSWPHSSRTRHCPISGKARASRTWYVPHFYCFYFLEAFQESRTGENYISRIVFDKESQCFQLKRTEHTREQVSAKQGGSKSLVALCLYLASSVTAAEDSDGLPWCCSCCCSLFQTYRCKRVSWKCKMRI